jgi:hypothetical protein
MACGYCGGNELGVQSRPGTKIGDKAAEKAIIIGDLKADFAVPFFQFKLHKAFPKWLDDARGGHRL